jgi:hypothetical protein
MDNADRGANAANDDLVEALKQRIRALADPPTSNEPAAELFRSEALGDLDRGRAPDLKSPHWRCRIIDPPPARCAPGDHTTTMSTGVITLCKAPADPAASPPGPAAPSARWWLILLA